MKTNEGYELEFDFGSLLREEDISGEDSPDAIAYFTKDLNQFEQHEYNRPLHSDQVLENSMREHGFRAEYPIITVRNGNNKLKVKSGHHRLYEARKLGIGVYYMVVDDDLDLHDSESSRSAWSLLDFASSRARAGDQDCDYLITFHRKYRIPLGSAAGLLNRSSSASRFRDSVKKGTFKANEKSWAEVVGYFCAAIRDRGYVFACSAKFVRAMAIMMKLESFDPKVMVKRVRSKSFPRIQLKERYDEYFREIEKIYNHGTSLKEKVSLAFDAEVLNKKTISKGTKKGETK